MLQHEPQEQSAATPTAQIRVTAEELAQAINALEASKDEEAQHLAGTVAIGQVVDELKLEATPEELWAQVQKQRARLVAEAAAAQEAREQTARLAAMQVLPRPRQRRRGRWWMILGIGWVAYGIVHGHLSPPHKQSNQGAAISANYQTLTSGTLGQNAEVSGDGDTIILQGNCPTLTVKGDSNHIRVEGTVGRIIADGDSNTIVYTQGTAPVLSGKGDGNTVGSAHP